MNHAAVTPCLAHAQLSVFGALYPLPVWQDALPEVLGGENAQYVGKLRNLCPRFGKGCELGISLVTLYLLFYRGGKGFSVG
jgi:hypothetical protein